MISLIGYAALAGLIQTAIWAQAAPSFRSNVELVAIPCAVTDSHGKPVAGLTREDFRVFDNDTPRIVESFWMDTDQPLTLGVIVDRSGSQGDQMEEHQATAAALIERILHPGDRAFVISMGEDVRRWPDIAREPGELFGAPCDRRQCGASPIWNTIYDAARIEMRPSKGNKALLILTDGFDSGSDHNWRQAAQQAGLVETAVYAIQYRSASGRRYAPDLYRLVDEAGGATFEPPRGNYEAIVSRLETDLRRRYVLGFRPEKLSGKLRHEVRVEALRPDLSVRARKVYFTPEAH